jgi:cation:H+ antiporter
MREVSPSSGPRPLDVSEPHHGGQPGRDLPPAQANLQAISGGTMLSVILQFTVCAVTIVIAGIFLTRFADAIADLTGVGRLLVGSLLLAGATSLPELAVDINARGRRMCRSPIEATSLPELAVDINSIRLNRPDLAVGDLFGSCLCNLMILAILDMSNYSRGRMLSSMASAHALSGMMTIQLAAIALLSMLVSPMPTIWLGVEIGLGSVVLLFIYLGGSRLVYLDQRLAARTETPGPDQAVLIPAHPTMRLSHAIVGFGISSLVILIAAPYLSQAANQIAHLSGLSQSFVGTTLVAVSTSLPELVASIAALRMGAYDLAIGNVFGSNSFNMAMLAILDLFQSGSLLSVVAQIHVLTGVAVILITAVAIAGQLYRSESRIRILEPDALLVLLLSLVAMWLVYRLG